MRRTHQSSRPEQNRLGGGHQVLATSVETIGTLLRSNLTRVTKEGQRAARALPYYDELAHFLGRRRMFSAAAVGFGH